MQRGYPEFRKAKDFTSSYLMLWYVKAELELDRAISRDEIKDLEKYAFEQFKPVFKNLTKVIVHN